MSGIASKPSRASRLSPYARSIVPDAAARDPHDFYPTPPGATMALCGVEQFPGVIWEPACGHGDMARVLRVASGAHGVLATDLVNRGQGLYATMDFLGGGVPAVRPMDHVVTNPPFKLAREFVDRALDVVPEGGKVAMLCRLMFLEAESRHLWWKAAPLRRVWVFSDRVPFERGRLVEAGEKGGRMVPYAWFVFERGYDGPAWVDHIKYRDGVAAWAALRKGGGV